MLKEFVMFQLVEFRVFKESLRVSNVVFDRCDKRLQALEVLLRSQVSNNAHFKNTSIEITIKVVKNVSFLQKISEN